MRHPGKWKYSRDVTLAYGEGDGFAGNFATPLELTLKKHKHRIGRIALACGAIARLEMQLLRLANEPRDLIVR
jgi:hypothetical protein